MFGPWERDTGVRDSISVLYQMAVADNNGDRMAPATYSPRNWLYSCDAASALAGLALAPSLAHDLYNVTPTEWFEAGAWARHLGVEAAKNDEPAITATSDSPPGKERAPIANVRIRELLAAWRAHPPLRAFPDYASWLDAHPVAG